MTSQTDRQIAEQVRTRQIEHLTEAVRYGRQVARILAAPIDDSFGNEYERNCATELATLAASEARRAFARGRLRPLARYMRREMCRPSQPGDVFHRIADTLEAILARRPKPKPRKRRTAPDAEAEMPRPARRKGPTKVDNVEHGSSAVCPCGKEFRRVGRAWSIKVHCSAKCRNKFWTKAHPRRAA